MIYKLLEAYLQNSLLGLAKPSSQITLKRISQSQITDSQQNYEFKDFEYEQLEISNYQFNIEYDFLNKEILRVVFIDPDHNLSIKLSEQLPEQLIKRYLLKEKLQPNIAPHHLSQILNYKESQQTHFNTLFIKKADTLEVKYQEEFQSSNEKKQNKKKLKKATSQLITPLKSLESRRIEKLAQKLSIPNNWKNIAEQYGAQKKKLWEIKYFERLMLLQEVMSKKYFYSYVQKDKIDIETKKELTKYCLPPDMNDEGLKKKRKTYSRQVICSLIE